MTRKDWLWLVTVAPGRAWPPERLVAVMERGRQALRDIYCRDFQFAMSVEENPRGTGTHAHAAWVDLGRLDVPARPARPFYAPPGRWIERGFQDRLVWRGLEGMLGFLLDEMPASGLDGEELELAQQRYLQARPVGPKWGLIKVLACAEALLVDVERVRSQEGVSCYALKYAMKTVGGRGGHYALTEGIVRAWSGGPTLDELAAVMAGPGPGVEVDGR